MEPFPQRSFRLQNDGDPRQCVSDLDGVIVVGQSGEGLELVRVTPMGGPDMTFGDMGRRTITVLEPSFDVLDAKPASGAQAVVALHTRGQEETIRFQSISGNDRGPSFLTQLPDGEWTCAKSLLVSPDGQDVYCSQGNQILLVRRGPSREPAIAPRSMALETAVAFGERAYLASAGMILSVLPNTDPLAIDTQFGTGGLAALDPRDIDDRGGTITFEACAKLPDGIALSGILERAGETAAFLVKVALP